MIDQPWPVEPSPKHPACSLAIMGATMFVMVGALCALSVWLTHSERARRMEDDSLAR